MELDKDGILRLIAEYEKHYILWNPKDEWHYNKNKKNAAWQSIANTLNIEVNDAKKKMSSLLGSLRREKAKGIKWITNGEENRAVYKSDWFAFKNFTFLLNKKNLTEQHDFVEFDTTNIKAEQHEDDGQGYSAYSETSIEIPDVELDSDNDEANMEQPPRKLSRKNFDIKNCIPQLHQNLDSENASEKFARYLAAKLELFDPRTKAILIHKINTLLFETEMNLYPNVSDMSPYNDIV